MDLIDMDVEIEKLEPTAIFGFDGKIPGALKVHPKKTHLIFPLGTRVSILSVQNNRQEFLCGHTNTISAIDVSASGAFVASGQISHMGFRSYVILWDWNTRTEKSRHELHRVCVESLAFTANDKFLISLGGQDDGNLVVWDVAKGSAVCGKTAVKEVTGHAKRVCALKTIGNLFLTAGEHNLRMWTIDQSNAKLVVRDANVGKLRRIYTSMKVNVTDKVMYAGTTSGDIVKIQLNCTAENGVGTVDADSDKVPILLGCYGRHNPKKVVGKDCDKYMNGVRDLEIIYGDRPRLVIGAGDGTVELVEERDVKFKDYPSPTWPQLKAIKRKKVIGAVTSLNMLGNDVLIGTDECEIYLLNLQTFELKLKITCNTSVVYDIAFPNDFSMVFATASYQSVRVWSLMKKQELLRIMVPNFSAAAVVFSFDGKSIVSAWNDGVIRAFTPLSGKLIYAIPNAHNKGCTALAMSSSDNILVSGGCEGQIRLWKIEPIRQRLLAVLKEHTAPVASLQFNCFDREIVSASSDGTCIIWDIVRQIRKHVLYANTQFTCAQFFPTGVQVLATGTDKRITYWEVFDASLVREIEGSENGSINCLSLNMTGQMFASAGNDQLIKLWDYQKGIQMACGAGHAAGIVTCKYSPCGKYLVSGSSDGAVIIWKIPEKFWPTPGVDPLAPALSTSFKKGSKYDKRPEDIKELETSRSKKNLHISECPPIEKSPSSTSASSKNKTPQN